MLQFNCQARWPIYSITLELLGSLELNYAHPPAFIRRLQGSLLLQSFAPLNGQWAENWTYCVGNPYRRFFQCFVWILRILWTSPMPQWDGCNDKTSFSLFFYPFWQATILNFLHLIEAILRLMWMAGNDFLAHFCGENNCFSLLQYPVKFIRAQKVGHWSM